MNRGMTAFFFFVLGVGVATVGWWTFRDEPRRIDPSPTRAPQLDAAVEAISRRIESIESKGGLPVASSQPVPSDPALIDIQARLSAIEAALAKLAPNEGGSTARVAPREAKAKDNDLVLELAARGAKDRGANTNQYWGWSPQELLQALGKPDEAVENTHGVFWVYNTEDGGELLTVRFAAGLVASFDP